MGSKYEPKNNQPGGPTRFLGSFHVYQLPKSNCFTAARATGAHKVLFNV